MYYHVFNINCIKTTVCLRPKNFQPQRLPRLSRGTFQTEDRPHFDEFDVGL